MGETIRELLSEEQIQKRIRELAAEISRDLNGEPVKLICILKGSVFFTCELAKHLTVPVYLDFMKVSSYGDSMESSGMMTVHQDLNEPIEGQNVLVVEDIIDTGNTLSGLIPMLRERGPKRVLLCTLLDKPSRRRVEVHTDYTGFEIPDEFVIGFGLDYAQKYRNLPYIGVLSLD